MRRSSMALRSSLTTFNLNERAGDSSLVAMKIGIIGSGNMGRTLGRLWSELGHEVLFGARDPGQAARAASAARGARHGGNDEAAEFGEVVLWSPRGVPAGEVVREPGRLDGKVVLDPNNGPLPEGHRFGSGPDEVSLAEGLAAGLSGARVVKAFNTLAQEVFELAPTPLRERGVAVFLAGDDAAAKRTAGGLVEGMGLVPVDCGPLAAARMLEGLGDFIRVLMLRQGLGVMAALSVQVLPAPTARRLGERTPTRLT